VLQKIAANLFIPRTIAVGRRSSFIEQLKEIDIRKTPGVVIAEEIDDALGQSGRDRAIDRERAATRKTGHASQKFGAGLDKAPIGDMPLLQRRVATGCPEIEAIERDIVLGLGTQGGQIEDVTLMWVRIFQLSMPGHARLPLTAQFTRVLLRTRALEPG